MIALVASIAIACICPQPSLDESSGRATIVFLGKTREETPGRVHSNLAQYRILRPLLGPQDAEFDMVEVLKGEMVGSRVSITIGPIHESCLRFEAGVEYLIFAAKDPKTGKYWVHPCGGTSTAKGSEAHVRELRAER